MYIRTTQSSSSLPHFSSFCKFYLCALSRPILDKIYDFQNQVLFKPTKAANEQFRNTKDSAFSYFIAGDNRVCEEDNGFALSNWSEILFDNSNIIVNENIGIAMGNYTFKNETSNIKVEYSFVYKKYGDEIKVILHHSSLPYKT